MPSSIANATCNSKLNNMCKAHRISSNKQGTNKPGKKAHHLAQHQNLRPRAGVLQFTESDRMFASNVPQVGPTVTKAGVGNQPLHTNS